MTIISTLLGCYLAGAALSPLVYWPAYFRLWARVLSERSPGIPVASKLEQAKRLIVFLLVSPWYTALWYLDEVLYPASRQVKVVSPVFVVAQPRTGTTLVHRILAEDEDVFASPRHIELRFPFLSVQRFLRITGFMEWLEGWDNHPKSEAGKAMSRLHANTLYDWEELGNLHLECSLVHFFTFFRFPYCSTLKHGTSVASLPPRVQKRFARTLHRFAQKVLWLQGQDKIFLAKEKESTENIKALARLYPDARFVFTVRHPSEWVTSFLRLAALATEVRAKADSTKIPGFDEWLLAKKVRDCRFQVAMDEGLPGNRKIVIRYPDLARDAYGVVDDIYRHFGLRLTPERRVQLRIFQARQWRRVQNNYTKRSFPQFTFYADHYRLAVYEPARVRDVLDKATGTLTRAAFCEFLAKETERLRRDGLGSHLVWVRLGDGNASSTERWAEALRERCRADDLIGRIEDHEFAVAMFGAEPTDLEEISRRARGLLGPAEEMNNETAFEILHLRPDETHHVDEWFEKIRAARAS